MMKDEPLVAQLGNADTSAYRRYLHMFVGSDSVAALIRYELLTSLLGPMPGAAGYLLRSRLYPMLFRRMGRGTVIGRSVVLRAPGQISLGASVMIDDLVVLDAKGHGDGIELGDQILVGRGTILSCTDGRIRMGSFLSIGPYCFFASKSHIDIGSNVSIGAGTQVMAGGHSFSDPDTPVIHQERIHQGVTIGDNVWIGSGAKILDGVTIGRDSIIGAGSVVGRDVPEWTVVLGNPARVIQKRK